MRLLVLFCCALLFAGMFVPTQAATVYVAPNGSDTNSGTLSHPFRTLHRAFQGRLPGDEIVLREGVYREPATPSVHGTEANPIRVRPYQGAEGLENVEIRGLQVIEEGMHGNGTWELFDASRHIYRIALTSNWNLRVGAEQKPANQLFVNGELMIEARWPNISSYRSQRAEDWALGHGSVSGSGSPLTGYYTAEGLQHFSTAALAGATIVFNPGQRWFVLEGTVVGNNPSLKRIQFQFVPTSFGTGYHLPDDADRFYLTGSLALLDAPGEWFFNTNDNRLYVRMPDDSSPAGHTLEMRQHDRFLDFTSASWIEFEHLRFVATYIFAPSGANGIRFNHCAFSHCGNGRFRAGLFLNASHHAVLNSDFRDEVGSAIMMRDGTTNNVVENNVVADTQFLSGEGNAIYVNGAMRVSRNTVFNTGGHGIRAAGPGAEVSLNHVYFFGALVQDVAGINLFGGGNQQNAIWSRNVVHDGLAPYGDVPGHNGSMGLRIDNGGATRAAYNLVLHRNVTWNTSNSGLNIWGVKSSQLDPGDTLSNVNIRLYHNTIIGASKMVGRSSDGFRFEGLTWRNNLLHGPLSGANNTSLVVATILNNLLSANSITGNLTAVPEFMDADEHDFRLRAGSPGIDLGVSIPPFSDHATDGAPDAGAYEFGKIPFHAGAVITVHHLPQLQVTYLGGTEFRVSGLPVGRGVPETFRIRLAGERVSQPDIRIVWDLVEHRQEAIVHVDIDSLPNVVSLEFSLDGTTFISTGEDISLSENPHQPLATPDRLALILPSNDSITLRWRDQSDSETGFEVQAAEDPGFAHLVAATTLPANANAHVFRNLTPDRTYYFRVRALGDGTTPGSPYSAPVSARVGSQQRTIAHALDDGSEFNLSFNPVRLTDPSELINVTLPAITALRIQNLPVPPDATMLEAHLQFRCSEFGFTSTPAHAVLRAEAISNSPPLLPVKGNLTNRVKTATATQWTNIPPWNRFEVTPAQKSPNIAQVIQEVIGLPGWRIGNALTFLAHMPTNSPFNYRSFATADDSLSNTTLDMRYVTPPPPEAAPHGLQAVALSSTEIQLMWTNVTPAGLGVVVERSTAAQRGFLPVAELAPGQQSYTDSGLQPDTTYYYRLRAFTGGGLGPLSTQTSAKTDALPAPATPSGFRSEQTDSRSAALAWDSLDPVASSLELQRLDDGLAGGPSMNLLLPAATLSFTDTNLAPGQVYVYRARALNSTSSSDWTAPLIVRTPEENVILVNPLTGWYRGRTNASPSSSLSPDAHSNLTHFTGGAAGNNEHYAQIWRYLPQTVALQDGESLRLDVAFTHGASLTNVGQALRFGFFKSYGTRVTNNIAGDNNSDHRDDTGYGVTIGTGGNTVSRYVEDTIASSNSAPLRDAIVIVGANAGSATLAVPGPHHIRFQITRDGTALDLRAWIDGVLLDGGRRVDSPHTLDYDMLMLVHRSSGMTWTLHTAAVTHVTPPPAPTPLQTWRAVWFGRTDNAGQAANDADIDEDGMPNLLEYALGQSPMVADSSALPLPVVEGGGASPLVTLKIPRDPAATDVELFVEASPELHPAAWSTNGVETVVNSGAILKVAAPDNVERRFLRLRAR